MNPVIESFDHYNGTGATTGLAARWSSSITGTNQTTIISGRFAEQAARFNTGGSFSTSVYWLSFEDDISAFSMSIALRFTGYTANTYCGFGNAASPQFFIRQIDSNRVALYRGSTTLWTSDPVYPQGVWHTYRLKGVVHNSTGELHLMIDNDLVYTQTGIDTTNLATSYINSLICSSNGTMLDVDDFVLIDDDTDFLPECRIQTLAPNADGSNLDLVPSTGTDHYAVVDELPVGTSDYLSGSVAGEYDLLELPDLGVVPTTIVGVNLVGFARKTDAASRAWNLGIQSGATDDLGVDLSLTSDVQYYSRMLPTDPNTGLEWEAADIGAAKLMPRVAV